VVTILNAVQRPAGVIGFNLSADEEGAHKLPGQRHALSSAAVDFPLSRKGVGNPA
jgi:hypothetical protein